MFKCRFFNPFNNKIVECCVLNSIYQIMEDVVVNRRSKLMFFEFYYFYNMTLNNAVINELFDMKMLKNRLNLRIFKLLSFKDDQEKANTPV